jgi:hypothetical protein
MKSPPKKRPGAMLPASGTKLTGLAEGNAGGGFTQACSERRAVDLLWLTARTLVHIDATLTDLQTLAQQQADLLRAILAIKRGAP